MIGPALLSIIWLAFLAMIGIGLGVVVCIETGAAKFKELSAAYRRRVQRAKAAI